MAEITRPRSELLCELMGGYFGDDFKGTVTMAECLDWYRELVLAETERSGGGDAAKPPKAAPKADLRTGGPGTAEKKAIHKRLLEYCEARGLGAAVTIAEHSGGALTDETVRLMRAGSSQPLEKWRALDKVLARLEKEGDPS